MDETRELPTIDQYDLFAPPLQVRSFRRSAMYAREPGEAEYFLVLSDSLPPDRELYLRHQIWWNANDKYRASECVEAVVFSEAQTENLNKLAGLLDDDDPDDRLTLIEIQRELGDFGRAMRLCLALQQELAGSRAKRAEENRRRLNLQAGLCLQHNRRVFRYS
jgi:hypothetical protein